MTQRLPVAALKGMLADIGDDVIRELCPGGVREGNVWSCPNPTRPTERRGSFKVWLTREAFGAWIEYDADERGDLIDLIALVKHTDAAGAIQWARRRLGLDSWDRAAEARAARAAAAMPKRERDDGAARQAAREARAFQIFSQATPILEDAAVCRTVRHYLHRRRIHLQDIANLETREIRAAELEHWTTAEWSTGPNARKLRAGHVGPAMVCGFRDGAGRLTGVHCTWIAADGLKKAPVPSPKLMLGTVSGSIVRITRGPSGLTVEEAVRAGVVDTLFLGEGMESMLSVGLALPEVRVWAAGSVVHVGFAPIGLACIGPVVVCQENDTKAPAREAFQAAMDRLEQHGKSIEALRSHIGSDFNDTLKGE